MILADIAKGETATADVFFLIAVILFAVAVIVSLIPIERAAAAPLVPAGLAFVALALLVL